MIISSVKCPKKTITSRKWARRNDSSAVGNLLAGYEVEDNSCLCDSSQDSEDGDEQPRRLILSEPLDGFQGHKIIKTFCPDCYCKSFLLGPSMERPLDSCCCIKQPMTKTRIKCAPNYMKRKVSSNEKNVYTKRREYYEDKTKKYFIKIRQRLDELEEELQKEQEVMERQKESEQRKKCRCKDCVRSNENKKKCCCKVKNSENKLCPCHVTYYRAEVDQKSCNPFDQDKYDDYKVKDLMQFRKQQYFACHGSTTSITSNKSSSSCLDSNCTHKCRLNPQNMTLEPENCDEYGTSRCSKCQSTSLSLSKPTLINSKSTIFTNSCSSLFDDMNLVPLEKETDPKDTMILTTQNNEKLEVSLPPNFLKEAHKPLSLVTSTSTKNFKNFKMPVPGNSMALRFQKGVIDKAISKSKQF